tara:strand:- start:40 stop:213 length:174 start_codon:yes stop_codon:yes gene_type:complete
MPTFTFAHSFANFSARLVHFESAEFGGTQQIIKIFGLLPTRIEEEEDMHACEVSTSE